MKNKRILICGILCTALCIISLVSFVGCFGSRGGDNGDNDSMPVTQDDLLFKKFSDESGELYEVYASEDRTFTSIEIPRELNGIPVKRIAAGAFNNYETLKSLTIPDSIVSIGEMAFSGCESLESIVIPDSVTSIGENAFMGCHSLKSITIPDSVAQPAELAFPSRSLESATMPAGFLHNLKGLDNLKNVTVTSGTEIPADSFSGCTTLQSVTLCDGITSIGNGAFSGCSALQSISIPSSVTSIGEQAFYGCSALGEIKLPAGITKIGSETFRECSSLEAISVPSGVLSIGEDAFAYCTALKEAALPEGLTDIGDRAFDQCTALENINIPSSVTHLGKNIINEWDTGDDRWHKPNIKYNGTLGKFYELTDWNEWSFQFHGTLICSDGTFEIEQRNFISSDDHLHLSIIAQGKEPTCGEAGYTSTRLCFLCKDVFDKGEEIPATGNHSFGSDKLCSVCNCRQPSDGLWFILINGGTSYSVAGIGDNTDSYVVIPEKHKGLPVTSIEAQAFSDCSQITNIEIPDSITYIGEDAFAGCSIQRDEYESVYYIGKWVFGYDRSSTHIYIRNGTLGIMNNAFRDGDLIEVIIPSSVVEIGDNAFSGCDKLTNVKMNYGLRRIGKRAFEGCSKLDHFYMPSTVTEVGEYAFYNCSELITVRISESIEKIGFEAFANCDKLNYNTYNGGKYLGSSESPYLCFLQVNDRTVTSFTLAASTRVIYGGMFFGTASIEELDKIAIGFGGCKDLTNITLPQSLKYIGQNSFSGCKSLTSISIPSGVVCVESGAFRGCAALESINTSDNSVYHVSGNCLIETATGTLVLGCKNSIIPTDGSIKHIGSYAFYECEGLTGELVIPDGVISIGDHAFYGCKGLGGQLVIPESVTSIGSYAFAYCEGLEGELVIPSGISSVSDGAFMYCSGITSFTIPATLTSIGDSAFSHCSSLQSITIPATLTSIGDEMFSRCDNLTNVVFEDGVKQLGGGMFSSCTKLLEVTIPTSVTYLPSSLFAGCDGFTINYLGSGFEWSEIETNNNWVDNMACFSLNCLG